MASVVVERGRRGAMWVAAVVAGAALAGAVPLGPSIPVAAQTPPAPVEITEAPPLTWGFKTSWRNYAGDPEVGGGATVQRSGLTYNLGWAFAGGSFDAATGTTVLRYEGSAHWAKYPLRDFMDWVPPGYTGSLDVPLLDITIADPVITISRDRSDIVVDAVARNQDTMEIEQHPDSAVVNLDVSTVVPDVDVTTTTWPAITATGGPGVDVAFAGMYPTGLVVDAVSFSYTGPGGGPDFSELFDEPGTIELTRVDNEVFTSTLGVSTMWWYDQANQIAHWRWQDSATFDQIFQAFDLETMSMVGEPWVLPNGDPSAPGTMRFADPVTGRGYYQVGTTFRWVTFDPETGTYQTGDLAQPFPRMGNSYAWDAVGERAMSISKVVPSGVGATDFDKHVWTVFTYTETEPGVWTRQAHTLPSFPTGLNRDGYQISSSAMASNMEALPDGSLLVLGTRQRSSNPSVPAPATFPGAYRIVLNGDGTATPQPIAGTDLPAVGLPYERVIPGPDGQMNLVTAGSTTSQVQRLDWDAASGTVTAGPVVHLTGTTIGSPQNHAVDPTDGTLWLDAAISQSLLGVKDGRIVANQYDSHRHPRGGWLFTGPDHTLYAQSNDGTVATHILGLAKYERVGVSPTVTSDPTPASATLVVGEATEEVAFTSTASGAPEPTRQWQVKAPGSARFVDLDGETGETLTVPAAPGMDGSQYRALYTNAAGSIASEGAGLSVEHAPLISFQPLDVTVVEGEPASFEVEQAALPEAEVTWQRYDGGFWRNIGPDDDGFALDSGRLTVTETNGDQAGARFRARLRNSIGTVHTRVATLSVAERPDDAQQVVGGELAWGVRESFRRYITGQIAHGAIEVSEGATADEDGVFHFPAGSGEVDGDVIDAAFGGGVRFTGHEAASTEAGVPALDMHISDIRLDIEGQDGTLIADVVSRGLSDGALTTYDDVAFAELDLAAVSPTPVEGGLRWADIPATLTDDGVPAFADFYPAGDPLDPLTVTLVLADEGSESRTATESFVTAALTDFLGAEPTEEQVGRGVAQVGALGKAAFLRNLTTFDAWLEAIVDDLYRDTLGRPADAVGAAFWVGRLRAGWTVARVAASFHASGEYYDGLGGGTDTTWVTDLYQKILGRSPDAGGLSFWVDETATRRRGSVALRLYQSNESARTRVGGLYQSLLGRAPDTGGLAYWAPVVRRRGDLALAVNLAASDEYQRRAQRRYP